MINIKLGKSYTTHIGVLVRALQMSQGDVIELGVGPYSTPLLHWLCKDKGRRLISYEDNPDYYNFAKQFRSKLHKIVMVKDWNDVDTTHHRGLVFIDHAASRRALDAIRFKDSADYIVIHDTEAEEHYGYQKVWPNFKYIYTWKEARPWVTIVSNYYEINRRD